MIAQEGILVSGSNDLYVCPAKDLANIIKIVFNSSSAFDILLETYRAGGSSTNTVYDLSLNAGDTIIDSSVYYLTPGDKLIVTTNTNVNYSVLVMEQVDAIFPFQYNQ